MGLAALATALSWEDGVRHWPLTPASIAGGLAFGMGAAMNGGCVFSTASCAMDGELGMALTILGWPIGILLAGACPIAPLGAGDLGLPGPLALILGLAFAIELGRIATWVARFGGRGLHAVGRRGGHRHSECSHPDTDRSVVVHPYGHVPRRRLRRARACRHDFWSGAAGHGRVVSAAWLVSDPGSAGSRRAAVRGSGFDDGDRDGNDPRRQ